MDQDDKDLYFPLLKRFRNPLIAGKKKKKWDKYKNMYHLLAKFKGCTSVLISVRGMMVQTTFVNKVTADYINFYFWGMVVKTRFDLKDMNSEDDLVCIRISTSYYECTVTTGGVFEKSDYMIFTTQKTPKNMSRPIYNLRRLVVQGSAPCNFPVDLGDPVPAMKKAIAEMEKHHEPGMSTFERKKIAFLAAASENRMSDKHSDMSIALTSFADGGSKKPGVSFYSGGKDVDSVSLSTKQGYATQSGMGRSKSKVSQVSNATGSVASTSMTSEGGGTVSKSETKFSADRSKSGSKQLTRERKYSQLRQEKYDWIKIDKDDPMIPPEVAPLYERTTSEESEVEEDDDIGYARKRQEKTFTIFGADGTVVQDEVTIGFKPCSGEQFPPRKWTSKKAKKEMVFKRRQTPQETPKNKPEGSVNDVNG